MSENIFGKNQIPSGQSNTNKRSLISEVKTEINEKIKGTKRVEYDVENIGKVVEELIIQLVKEPQGIKEEDSTAIQNVYINGELVRKVNLINLKIIQSDPRFEPYNFLQTDQTTLEKMRSTYFQLYHKN